jgi:hypothetical protein
MARRGWGDDGIYWVASRKRYVGAISLGYGPDGKRIRPTVSGKTKQEVKDKLKALHDDLASPVRSPKNYTLSQAVGDWLSEGMQGRPAETTAKYRNVLKPVLQQLGADSLPPSRQRTSGPRSPITLPRTRPRRSASRLGLERAIRHAEANDLIARIGA